MMKNKLPIKEGDILFDSKKEHFIHILKANHVDELKDMINYRFHVIGEKSSKKSVSMTLRNLKDKSLVRYGNREDIGYTLDDILALDFNEYDAKTIGAQKEKLARELKMKFLLSY